MWDAILSCILHTTRKWLSSAHRQFAYYTLDMLHTAKNSTSRVQIIVCDIVHVGLRGVRMIFFAESHAFSARRFLKEIFSAVRWVERHKCQKVDLQHPSHLFSICGGFSADEPRASACINMCESDLGLQVPGRFIGPRRLYPGQFHLSESMHVLGFSVIRCISVEKRTPAKLIV